MDVKPGNVMVTPDGTVKLLDFGLAKLTSELHAASGDRSSAELTPLPWPPASPGTDDGAAVSQTRPPAPAQAPPFRGPATPQGPGGPAGRALTLAGSLLGTPGYMAPEAWRGQEATAQSDLYSFGALLYELIAGRLPHDRPRAEEICQATLEHEVPPLTRLVPAVERRLAALIMRCLKRLPAERPASAQQVVQELEALEQADHSPSAAVVLRQAMVHRWPVALGLALLLLAPPLLALSYLYGQKAEPRHAGMAVGSRRSLAVLGLKELRPRGVPESARSASLAGTAAAFAELIGSELSAGEKLLLLPPDRVAHLQVEQRMAAEPAYSVAALSTIQQHLGAELVAAGSYQAQPDGMLQITLAVQDTGTGARLACATASGRPDELFDLVARIGHELRAQLGLGRLTGKQARQLDAARPASPQIAELYATGLDRLRRFDAVGARAALQEVTRQAPDFPLGHLALGEVWATLGYEERAQAAVRRAYTLADALAPQARSQIEARFFQINHEWERCFAVYRALRSAFPEQLDYALALADAQLLASQPEAALVTLQTLRRDRQPAPRSPNEPPPGTVRHDPRLDLLEGRVRAALNDPPAAIALLARAAAQAQATGSPLVEARARLEAAYAYELSGAHEQALHAAEQAAPLYEGVRDRGGLADTLIAISSVQMNQGEIEAALATAGRALNVLMEIQNSSLLADHLGNIAILLAKRGRLEQALARAESGYLLARELGQKEAIGTNLVVTGWIASLMGDLLRAQQVLEQARGVFAALNQPHMTAWVAFNQGQVLMMAGATTPHLRLLFDESLALRQQLGLKGFVAESEVALAELALTQHQPTEAATRARAAARQFASEHQHDLEAQAQVLLSAALFAQGQDAAARTALHRATEQNRDHQNGLIKSVVMRRALWLQVSAAAERTAESARQEIAAALAAVSPPPPLSEALELRLLQVQLRPASELRKREAAQLVADAQRYGFIQIATKAASLK